MCALAEFCFGFGSALEYSDALRYLAGWRQICCIRSLTQSSEDHPRPKDGQLSLCATFLCIWRCCQNNLRFHAKIVTSNNSELQFDAKYWATIVISIVISFICAIGTFALVIHPKTGACGFTTKAMIHKASIRSIFSYTLPEPQHIYSLITFKTTLQNRPSCLFEELV